MTIDDVINLAKRAAKSSAKRGCYMICSDDLDDMTQVAAIAIWQCAGNRSNAYLFSVGRTAATNWLIWWKYGATNDKLRGLIGQIETPMSIDEISKSIICSKYDDRNGLSSDEVEKIKKVLIHARRKRPIRMDIIEIDIWILNNLIMERSTENMVFESGKSKHYIYQRRQEIRHDLRRYYATE